MIWPPALPWILALPALGAPKQEPAAPQDVPRAEPESAVPA